MGTQRTELRNGVDPLMLQEVAQHPGNSWLRLLQLFLSGRPIFLIIGDHITGGPAKKILLLAQRRPIFLAGSYFPCEDSPGRTSM